MRTTWTLCAVILVVGICPDHTRADDGSTYEAATTADPKLPRAELELLLTPLTKDQLAVEAKAWLEILQDKVQQISDGELAVMYKSQEIKKAKAQATAAEEASQAAQDAETARAAQDASGPGAGEQAAEAQQAADAAAAEAQAAAEEARLAEEKAAANQAAKAAEEAAAKRVQEEGAAAPGAGETATAAGAVNAKAQIKTALLEDLNELRTQRTALIDRTNVVLDAWDEKGGDSAEYRKYVAAVSGIRLDVSDAGAAWTTVAGWVTSPEGGIRWGLNLLKFLATLLGFWILSIIVGKVADKALGASRNLSSLIRDFLSKAMRRIVLVVGIVVALAALEINIGPLLAVIGAAGFVVAFALQGSLANFASGIMILVYRPFDVGDVIDAGGVSGKVSSMNLVSTTIKTFDNKVVIVPNNSVWGGVITNVTGSRERRVDMVFGIGYQSDIGKAQSIMENIVKEHPLTLDEPEPVIKVHELADSSVNFICRPWAKTADYWNVFWDVTRSVKEEFDKAGVSIPFPQRDVHVYHEGKERPIAEVASGAGKHAVKNV